MEKLRSNSRIALLVVAMLFSSLGWSASVIAADGAVLFAPGEYQHFGDASYHETAVNQLAQRLHKAGVPEGRVVRLCGKQATASALTDALIEMVDSVGSEDLLLIAICSHGVQFDNCDYVLAADTPKNVREELGQEDGKIISILSVLEEMAISASQRRLLIVDGAAKSEPALADATARFGRLPLKVADGQWVILNRSNQVSQRGQEPPMTDFAWSVLDGIAFHADGNRNGNVSILELADYVKLYAEAQDNLLPTIAGKISGDVSLVSTSAASDDTFPREALAANARRLVAEARKTLLLELDVRAGMGLLDRASRLCSEPELQREIDEVSATAAILRGKADQVLPTERDEATTYLAVLPREAGLYVAGAKSPSRRLQAGTVVQATHHTVITANGRNWIYVSVRGALLPEWEAGQVSFKSIPFQKEAFWMSGDDLATSEEPTIPAATLRQQFLKPAKDVGQLPTAAAAGESR